jgi:hypothetical protein
MQWKVREEEESSEDDDDEGDDPCDWLDSMVEEQE